MRYLKMLFMNSFGRIFTNFTPDFLKLRFSITCLKKWQLCEFMQIWRYQAWRFAVFRFIPK